MARPRVLGQFGKVCMVAKGLARKKFAAGGAGQPWWPGESTRDQPMSTPEKSWSFPWICAQGGYQAQKLGYNFPGLWLQAKTARWLGTQVQITEKLEKFRSGELFGFRDFCV